MLVSVLFEQIGIMAFMVFLGMYAKKRGILNDDAQKHIGNVLVRIGMPMLTLSSCKIDSDSSVTKNLLLTILIYVLYTVVLITLGYFISRRYKFEKKEEIAFRINLVQGNIGYVAVPICAALFGAEGLFYSSICNAIAVTFTFSYGIGLLTGQKGIRWSKVLKNPNTIAAFAVIIIVLAQIKLPGAVVSAFNVAGSMTAPLSMILMGAMVTDCSLADIFTLKSAYLVSFIRLLVTPILLSIILYAAGVEQTLASIIIICIAVPSGVVNCVLAKQYDCGPREFSRIIAQTMIFSALTIPLVMAIVGKLWSV